MKKYAGEEFLNKIYKDLYKSDIVKRTGKGGNKNEDVSLYMNRLNKVTNDVLEHDHFDWLKKLYYDKYVIKKEDVPESYFELQKKINLERGFGHLEYDDETKNKEINKIIKEQESSLSRWIDYFASENTNNYPTWFKYFCFQGMVRLGFLDKEKGVFTKRTKSTVKPFVELNSEAIGFIYDQLVKVLDKRELSDSEIEKILNNGSFSKIYAYTLNKLDSINKENSNSNDGIWKKYKQGSDPNILFNDIKEKGTGWCTAGGIETATNQLNGGDFYVYFTKNLKNEYTIPRIAIRTENGSIAEIRGIDKDQNLEVNLENVVDKKLEEFPDKEEYKKKIKDMKKLTDIYNRFKNNIDLTINDLIFLYEIEEKINGFGWNNDPRIDEIISTRNSDDDIDYILSSKDENGKIFELKEGLNYNFDRLTVLKNNLVIPENSMASFKNLETITGKLEFTSKDFDIKLPSLKKLKGLKIPVDFREEIHLESIEELDKFFLVPENAKGIFFNSLDSSEFKKLIIPKKFKGLMVFKNEEYIYVGDDEYDDEINQRNL